MSYWENLARQTRKKAISSNDPNLDILEKHFIKKYLRKSHKVLDIGSGDGLATLEFAQIAQEVDGIECASSVLKIAQKNQKIAGATNVNWINGSVLAIDKIASGKNYNCFISKRCLINLSGWEEQNKALMKITALLKPGGLFLLCEGFNDNFKNLQNLRQKYGLEPDTVVSFNHYFERDKFEKLIKKHFEIIEQNNFGLYYFLSHFYYPLLIKPKNPQYRSKMNQVATELALKEKMLEEFGYISFYALKKK